MTNRKRMSDLDVDDKWNYLITDIEDDSMRDDEAMVDAMALRIDHERSREAEKRLEAENTELRKQVALYEGPKVDFNQEGAQ